MYLEAPLFGPSYHTIKEIDDIDGLISILRKFFCFLNFTNFRRRSTFVQMVSACQCLYYVV